MTDHLAAYGQYYKKALACAAGIILLLLFRHLEIDMPGMPDLVFELIVGLLTIGGVERVSNGPKPAKADDEFRGEL